MEVFGEISFDKPGPTVRCSERIIISYTIEHDSNYNQNNLSSFWIEDASYLRLKNIQLGYTLPAHLTKKIRIDKCRFYVSGENLLTITNFFDSYDPEMPVSNESPVSSGGFYPAVKTVSIGVSVTLR